MRILIISQYFPPEVGAGSNRNFHLATHLASKAHQVKVVCGLPNYPKGKIYSDYTLKLFHHETLNSVEIIRTFVIPTRYTSNIKRILNYSSFSISAFLASLFLKYDLIISSSPPLSVGVVGLLLSYIKGKPLVFDIRDVWPGAAIDLGVLRSRLFIGVLKFFEKAIYKKATFLIAPTEETKEIILKDNSSLEKEK